VIMDYVSLEAVPKIVNTTRKSFQSGKTLPYEFRLHQLKQLRKMVIENAAEFIKAGQDDMGNRSEEFLQREEIDLCVDEMTLLIDNLHLWMTDKDLGTHPEMGRGKLHYTPRGTTLIIGAWNFPLNLCLVPLAAAISAGCTAVLKPSEVSPAVASAMKRLVPEYVDSSCFKVVLGAVKETTALLENKWDFIFFTGAPAIGKIVAVAAAKTLTPYVLELGGKNPVIVDDTVDLDAVADHLVAGRYLMNCGQNCTSPEWVIVDRHRQDDLVKALRTSITKQMGADPQRSSDFFRIINQRHFERIKGIIANAKRVNVVIGGDSDATDLYVAPTVIQDVDDSSNVMQSESFGPILSVYPVDNVRKEAISIIHRYPKPLMLFLFSNDEQFRKEVMDRTDSGGLTYNSTIDHFTFPGFPFGGTGNSGCGRYHGKYSFLAFSHEKPVLAAPPLCVFGEEVPAQKSVFERKEFHILMAAMGVVAAAVMYQRRSGKNADQWKSW